MWSFCQPRCLRIQPLLRTKCTVSPHLDCPSTLNTDNCQGVCGTGPYYCDAPSCQFQYGPACDANQTPTGVNTTSVPRPKLGSTPYGVSIRDCGIPGKVALTFDDGPYIYTSAMLDVLKDKGVKATFFLAGNNGGKGQINDPKTGYPALIQRMYNEGHQIGSHTWSHADLSTLTRSQRYDQVVKNEIALTDILGFFPTYLRPPYESCNADCLNDLSALGYHVVSLIHSPGKIDQS